MASSGVQRRGSTVSSSTTSYTLTRLYRKNFRKTSKSQNHPANRLYLAGSRSLGKKAQLRTSILSLMTALVTQDGRRSVMMKLLMPFVCLFSTLQRGQQERGVN